MTRILFHFSSTQRIKTHQSKSEEPHAAYTVFMKGYKSKFTYFMCTIESFEDYVDSIQEGDGQLTSPNTFRSNGAPP